MKCPLPYGTMLMKMNIVKIHNFKIFKKEKKMLADVVDSYVSTKSGGNSP